MKLKHRLLIMGWVILSLNPVFAQIQTPAPSPLAKLEQKVGLGTISVEYSRPGMKDRQVFGGLVPFGKVWRTGANASTKISFSEDAIIEGKNLPKGTYSLFTVPGPEKWDIIFYTDANVSGTPKVWEASKEAVRVTVPVEIIPYTFETFLIDINDIKSDAATLYIIWENTLVAVKIKFDVDTRVMSNIDKVISGPGSDDYYLAARYYYDNAKDLNVALPWVQKANQMDPKFWKLRLESLILAKLGRKTEAIEVAEKSKALAIEAGNDDYVKMNSDSILEWKK